MIPQPYVAVDTAIPQDKEFRRQAFLAALTGIMASPKTWNDANGRTVNGISQYVAVAWKAADAAIISEDARP